MQLLLRGAWRLQDVDVYIDCRRHLLVLAQLGMFVRRRRL